MSRDLIVSEGAVQTDGGLTGPLTLATSLQVTGAGNVVTTPHDALYAYPSDMVSSGTLIPESAQDVGLPRWSLPDGSTTLVKWVWAIPVGWNTVAARWGWNKEAATSGNVDWSFAYRLVYPFVLGDVDVGAVTTVSLGSIAVSGTQYGFQYELPAAIAAIAVADGAFGSKPFMQCALIRAGLADTYNGAVGVSLATLTRI